MSVPQQLLINRMRERCQQLDERYPGYRADVIRYLAEILSLERASNRNVAQQVEAQLTAFGDLYHRRAPGDGDGGE
jgi:hypothetical protein